MPSISRQQVSRAIAQLMPNIIRGVQLDVFAKRQVTQTQFLVVIAIHAYGRCTMGTLARSLHVSMPTTTGVVNRLVQGGLVRRFPHPEDRRQVVVELTAKGQAFILQVQQAIRRRWEEVLKALGPRELEAFYHVVNRLREQLQPDR